MYYLVKEVNQHKLLMNLNLTIYLSNYGKSLQNIVQIILLCKQIGIILLRDWILQKVQSLNLEIFSKDELKKSYHKGK